MKLAALALCAVAAVTQFGASAAPTNYACAGAINYQVITILNTGSTTKDGSRCIQGAEGEGYTVGFANFSTIYGDALAVVQGYMKAPTYKGEFDKYLPVLQQNAAGRDGTVEGLEGFCDAWAAASKETLPFFSAQIDVARAMYDKPSLLYARKLKLKFPVGKSILFDTAVTDGFGQKGNGVGAMVSATNAQFTKDAPGNSGSTLNINGHKVDEIVWYRAYLDVRDKLATNPNTKTHTKVYRSILDNGGQGFNEKISFTGPDGKKTTAKCGKASLEKDRLANLKN
ncbi:hypothetical protein H4R18_003079 [Coemansia javaensis]|uniref:Chitosanase n=1 Tax=Coemansia javaensis TaxID=2761396 RepID=A0A9W8LGU5_9FUNG|nr:hypothetical protein H4R18_003079 [Coemansia javaensis]